MKLNAVNFDGVFNNIKAFAEGQGPVPAAVGQQPGGGKNGIGIVGNGIGISGIGIGFNPG